MIRGAETFPAKLAQTLSADLRPFPGRWELTWRIALAAALVATFAMSFELPEAAVSCYLVSLVMKPGDAESVLEAIVLAVLIAIVIAVVVFISRWTVDSPTLRLLAMATVSFLMLFLAAASRLGGMASILGMLIAVILSLLYQAPSGDLFSTALRYYWEMVAMPMGVICLFSLTLGTPTVTLLRRSLEDRLSAALRAITAPSTEATTKLRAMLHKGNQSALKRAGLASRFHLAPDPNLRQITSDISASYYLLVAANALGQGVSAEARDRIAPDVAAARTALRNGARMPEPHPLRPDATLPESVAYQALSKMADLGATSQQPETKAPFFVKDAFGNPAYQRYALKTTFAAMVCYIIYTSLDWQGIHTAMITCYVASLRTTGDTFHKLILRIGGCFIGAAMGIGTIVFVIPHVDSVGGLMIVIFVGTLPAAWLSTGSERLSYAGIQIGLVYYLSILNGFGPSLDMEIARDRFIGILIGNIAVYLMATLVWPVSLDMVLRRDISKTLLNLGSLAALPVVERSSSIRYVGDVEAALGRLEEALYRLPLETGMSSTNPSPVTTLRTLADELEQLTEDILFSQRDLVWVLPRMETLSRLAVDRGASADNPDQTEAQMSDPIEVRLKHLETTLVAWR